MPRSFLAKHQAHQDASACPALEVWSFVCVPVDTGIMVDKSWIFPKKSSLHGLVEEIGLVLLR